MNNTKPKYPIHLFILFPLLLILLFFPCRLFSQQWTDPVNVSSIEGLNLDPDFSIDYSGNIHVVWAHKVEENFWKLYYSMSSDNGETWSPEYDLIVNTEFWYGNPHIVCNSINKLFISYEYNLGNPSQTKVYYKEFNGSEWEDPVLISENMPGSDHSFLTIDADDRIYFFWAYSDNKFYYRYLEEDTLSTIYYPYYTGGPHFFNKCVSDINNNLYCIGNSYNPLTSSYSISHFYYDYINELWMDPLILSNSSYWEGNDITLDSQNLPHIAWHEPVTTTPPWHDATFYSYFDGQNWHPKELVIEDPFNQLIAIDQYNNLHVVNREKNITGWQIVHYKKINNQWIGYIIDSSTNFCNPTSLLYSNNRLNLIYYKDFLPGIPDGHIIYSKCDISTNALLGYLIIDSVVIFPNPSNETFNICFKTLDKSIIRINVFSLQGNLIYWTEKEFSENGNHRVIWDGKDNRGRRISNGLYLIRLQVGRYTITRSVELIK